MKIKIKKIDPKAPTPEYKTSGAAGFDISTMYGGYIPVGKTKVLHTGISFEIPTGYELQIRTRSGMAMKGIIVTNAPGTIDSDYRGEILLIISNISQLGFYFQPGDRLAQGVIAPVIQAEFEEVLELTKTERNEKGFGSTGI